MASDAGSDSSDRDGGSESSSISISKMSGVSHAGEGSMSGSDNSPSISASSIGGDDDERDGAEVGGGANFELPSEEIAKRRVLDLEQRLATVQKAMSNLDIAGDRQFGDLSRIERFLVTCTDYARRTREVAKANDRKLQEEADIRRYKLVATTAPPASANAEDHYGGKHHPPANPFSIEQDGSINLKSHRGTGWLLLLHHSLIRQQLQVGALLPPPPSPPLCPRTPFRGAELIACYVRHTRLRRRRRRLTIAAAKTRFERVIRDAFAEWMSASLPSAAEPKE